eukprot:4006926-Alexandrium_andersonii.AAC.1
MRVLSDELIPPATATHTLNRLRFQHGDPVLQSASTHALEPGTERAQERPQVWSLKLPRGAFCGMFCAGSESANAICGRG